MTSSCHTRRSSVLVEDVRCFRGTANMLKIRDLSKTYANGVQALKGITLDIPTGMFGLLGPNGAGKSTLMRPIATLQDADTGRVPLGDLDVLADKKIGKAHVCTPVTHAHPESPLLH